MKNISFFHYTKANGYQAYLVSCALIALCTVIKLTLFDVLGSKTPFLLYFCIIVFIAQYYGAKPGVFTSILTVLVVDYFFFEPYFNITLTFNGAVQIFVFLLECLLLVYLCSGKEKEARRSGECSKMFQTLVEKSTDGIMMVKLDGKIGYISPSVSRITGYEAAELLQMDIWALLLPDEIMNVKEHFYQTASHPGESIHILHQVKHKSGNTIWVENTVTNLLEEPLLKAVIMNFTDVTARVVRDRQMEDFIGIASHELKTPLTSLKAYTQVLEMRMKKENNATSTILVTKIDQQINRVVSMIFDLLDVTKLQSGIMHLNIAPFDINELINEVTEAMQNSGHKHQIEIDLASAVTVRGDRARISQVLTNMISNGIKYSPDSASVNVYTRIEDNQVKVFVADHGIGIPPGEIRNIFKRFYRVSSVKESFQGLGLGLYISHQIIERHGGKMEVISEINRGSTFWFSLPLF
ncbi:ATP-binding protein [Pararcticibacter amylolyticus]|uniref:histidine kinase n=1 Tax=Pararcticibacter amylolyticus TaxID=2173175 RepID=A0A2U2PGG5_9SPHI|nr:ATP-binding protein [Pararcticibacter amylolyticus]PWG80473.1 hypothetical protein DDR33_12815 [Pararcticibacter amylolyticus]